MGRFGCDDSFRDDMREYAGSMLLKYGGYSPSAKREIMCLADEGNVVAAKMYADLVFYGGLMRSDRYREAFGLYLKSAGITVDENGVWKATGKSYPLAFFSLGFCLVNYRAGSVMKDCEAIDVIDAMSYEERLSTALELTLSCLEHINTPAAINLVGRILYEASMNETLYEALKGVIEEEVAERDFDTIPLHVGGCASMEDCEEVSRQFFEASASEGYVYACNNLAAKEAERIVSMDEKGADGDELKKAVEKYIGYLKLPADKYEPYAANRLGMFYLSGEIKAGDGKVICRDFIDKALAKEYFKKATSYLDMNSAWAFYNLIKNYHKDYDNNIELMNEHMDYIKELNPKVYDLAMEL